MLDYQALVEYIEMTGYQPKTTFWNDFSIAERFGDKAIEDTYNRAFNEWKSNTEYLTELVMVLNWKMWRWADQKPLLSQLYQKLWEKADGYCMDNLKDKDLDYFLSVTD